MTNRDKISPIDGNRTSKVLWYLYWIFILLSIVLIGWTIYLKTIWTPDPATIGFFRPKKEKNIINVSAKANHETKVNVDNFFGKKPAIYKQKILPLSIDKKIIKRERCKISYTYTSIRNTRYSMVRQPSRNLSTRPLPTI